MRLQTVLAFIAGLILTGHTASAAPITAGTLFLDPDIVTASDPSTFVGLSYAGTGCSASSRNVSKVSLIALTAVARSRLADCDGEGRVLAER